MFRHVICWEPERTYEVINTQAESAPSEVFMAVHTNYPLTRVEVDPNSALGWNSAPRRKQDQAGFLEEFLAPHRRHVQAVVLGDTGSGKSHLVHWMQLNIPSTPGRVVVTIPRAQTTLRSILEKLIDLLDDDGRERYRRRLTDAAPVTATREELQQRIIGSLIIALTRQEQSDEVVGFLIGGLQDFLRDPVMQSYHLANRGIIAELASHIAEPSGREAREARRRFTEADLHLDEVLSPRVNDLAAPTRRFMRQLNGSEFKARAVELLNGCLDSAVTEVLGFTGEVLVTMMREIRQHLATDGKELVLLFEDFARAEGIDRALLDALMEQSDGANSLAKLRWVIAVTTGYYERAFLDTHRARMDFVIDMDLSRGPSGIVSDDEVGRFAARYLNALRVTSPELKQWYRYWTEGDRQPLPNACSSCPHQPDCHAAFGAVSVPNVGQVGLYPFTQDALLNMYERRGDGDKFNPRTLLDHVMKPVCDVVRASHLENDGFPDEPLVEEMNGRRLPPSLQVTVHQYHPRESGRYLAALELWCREPGQATELPEGIFTAFGLQPLSKEISLESQVAPPAIVTATTGASQPSAPPPPVVDRKLQAIGAWANGGALPQDVAEDLRRAIFACVTEYIDWDRLHLRQAEFASATEGARPFRNRSISFRRQQTARTPSEVSLELPISESKEEQLLTAMAFEGLLNFARHRNWAYAGGEAQMLALADCVANWSLEVVVQLSRLPDPRGDWDPVATAVEVLVVGAALAGRPTGASTAVERADTIFAEWPDPSDLASFAPEWRELYRRIHSERTKLSELVHNRTSLGKGGQAGALVDAAKIMPAVRDLTRHWDLRAAPPSHIDGTTLDGSYKTLFNLHSRLTQDLANAVAAERQRRLQTLDQVTGHMAGSSRADVVKTFEALLTEAVNQGAPIPAGVRSRFQERFEVFKQVQVDEAIRLTKQLAGVANGAETLPDLGLGRRANAMQTAREFFEVAEELMAALENHVTSKELQAGSADSIATLIGSIERAFGELDAALEKLGPGS